jgi:hypothetical protein
MQKKDDNSKDQVKKEDDNTENQLQDDQVNLEQPIDEFKIYVKARELQVKILKELTDMIEGLENKGKHQDPK